MPFIPRFVYGLLHRAQQHGLYQLAAGPVRRIVLVSCDPAAMARDVAAMHEAGRVVTGFDAVDLFPNTHHFECVTVLERPAS